MHSLRLIGVVFLCIALLPPPTYAVWEYSLAAQLAMLDELRTTCGKIEPRLSSSLNDELSQIVRSNNIKTIHAARKTQEYKNVFRLVLYEHLRGSWNDQEEKAHLCEEIYAERNNNGSMADQRWWHDRSCTGVSLDSEDSRHCAAGPQASVSFGTTLSDRRISVLRIVPSSDVSFPHAGTFVQQSELPDKIISVNYIPGTWAIPDSIQFEWKEWPLAAPKQPQSDHDLNNLQYHAADVRTQVQRKRATIEVRSLIPGDVISKLAQSERKAGSESATERSMKLFFVFMQDGLRFRWEQWHGSCIETYGGNNIDLPPDQLLSEPTVCDAPEVKPCDI